MLERAWDGFKVHTGQGWNIGKPPYGYLADKVDHPVPAKAAEGQTKTRLVPDPVRAPVVEFIFRLRVVERLGYDAIAQRLNADRDLYPVPEPTSPRRRRGTWSGSAVRDILTNPKYTGYMVWNRRATKSGGKVNPPEAWVWSDQPTHEPLVSRETFESAAQVAQVRRGSRSESGPNTAHLHTQARVFAAVICPLWRLRAADVRQDPPRPRLLLLLSGRQQRRPSGPLPRRPPQDSLRP